MLPGSLLCNLERESENSADSMSAEYSQLYRIVDYLALRLKLMLTGADFPVEALVSASSLTCILALAIFTDNDPVQVTLIHRC